MFPLENNFGSQGGNKLKRQYSTQNFSTVVLKTGHCSYFTFFLLLVKKGIEHKISQEEVVLRKKRSWG